MRLCNFKELIVPPLKALLLAGGYGSRLKPLTNIWPKCLMPVGGKPLLEFWIEKLLEFNVEEILVNIHYFPEEVIDFLNRDKFRDIVTWSYEETLLGTAGTLIQNKDFFDGSEIFLAHADNFCTADLKSFLKTHKNRDKNCLMTMMTFDATNPRACGIVTHNNKKVMNGFYEKVSNPPSNLANGAVYLLGENFLDWLSSQEAAFDFSLDVLPNLIGKVQLWKNEGHHVDIGTIENFLLVQDLFPKRNFFNTGTSLDQWSKDFLNHPIHNLLQNLYKDND